MWDLKENLVNGNVGGGGTVPIPYYVGCWKETGLLWFLYI